MVLRLCLCRAGKGTVRIATTTPFYLPALLRRLSGSRGVSTVCLVYDLYPDALFVAGALKPGGPVAGVLARATRFAIRESSLTIYLGEHLMKYAEKTYGPAKRCTVIPVGADGSFLRAKPELTGPDARIRMLYAGTMGRMHDVETLRAFLESDFPENIEIAFNSSGAKYEAFRDGLLPRMGALKGRISLEGPLSDDNWMNAMGRAHVALVTMLPEAARVVMPSKSQSAMVAGQAILAICPMESDLAEMVLRHDCGWHVVPGDLRAMQLAVAEIASDPDLLLSKRKRAYDAGHRFYEIKGVARSIIEEVRNLH